ncbi:NACHT, LRR and PYD domains-containing protein 3-like [Rhinatrema bivittatum]|uniref:NACHT, LRR and PYD domains-containing protein 3-like n=1 Tax=Rhinatrema bivittatum TaxID=194408 RepID=UPI00112CE68F|nr:NACHT, LRR and PYD domains-containing protein 3-like [Rhinatrema bivittatum]
MALSARDLLTSVLEDLLEVELRRFKIKLCEIRLEDAPCRIPRGSLERADAMDIAGLMLSYCGEGPAVVLAVQVLNLINKKGPCCQPGEKCTSCIHVLLDCSLAVSSPKFCCPSKPGTQPAVEKAGLAAPEKPVKEPEIYWQALYKAAIKQKFEKLKDYNSLPGDWVYLEERYIDLLIIKKHRSPEEKEIALLSHGQTHLEMLNKFHERDSVRTHLETFLDTEKGREPLTVILQGPAGIGKSYTVRKMMLDWASERLYQGRFDYVFYLNLKELGCEKRPVSLHDLMLANWQGLQPLLDQILSQPQRLLFLLDGFDELKSLLSQDEEIQLADNTSRYPAVVIVSLILKKQLVPGASLLITTRPTALDRLESCIQADCYLEVLGFLEEERQAFFYNFFQNDRQAFEAYQAIKGNDTIPLCAFVPLVCWIVCTILKEQMEKDCKLSHIHTTTQIFLHFIQILLRHHHYQSLENSTRASTRGIFEKLGSLALHGILSQRVIFEKEDLEAHFLETTEISTIFLNTVLRQNLLVETLYSFGHVTFQEFFAAMFFFVSSEQVQMKLNQLVEETLKEENGQLLFTIRFLFGLSNPRSYQMLNQLVFFQPPSPAFSSIILKEELLSWIQKAACSPRMNDPHFHLELLHCLYELHQDSFVKQVMVDLDNLSFVMFPLKRSDCLVLAYCIQCCEAVQNLHLFCCNLGVEEVRHLLPVLKKCRLLQLEVSNLPNTVLRDICSSLSPQQSVTSIQLTSSISPVGKRETMFKCSAVQGSEMCRLQICFLPEEDTVTFCSWMIPNHRPRKIMLQNTKLSNDSLRRICLTLSATKCPVHTLRISGNLFTKVCIPDLSSVLVTNPYLAQLDLSGNQLRDDAVMLLCSGLQAAETELLQHLSLEENDLTEACVPELSSLLLATPSLSQLKLGFNKLGDEGARWFWPVLSNPRCRLECLGMQANGLGDACIDSLAAHLLQNRTLRTLELSNNSLTLQSVPTLDVIWRECSELHVLSLAYNQIPKVILKNYSMFYNSKSKKESSEHSGP